MAAIAFTWDCQVGTDVGHIRPLADLQRIAARYFSPEAAELMLLCPQVTRACFLSLLDEEGGVSQGEWGRTLVG
jgi:phosphopantetheinyl transferase